MDHGDGLPMYSDVNIKGNSPQRSQITDFSTCKHAVHIQNSLRKVVLALDAPSPEQAHVALCKVDSSN